MRPIVQCVVHGHAIEFPHQLHDHFSRRRSGPAQGQNVRNCLPHHWLKVHGGEVVAFILESHRPAVEVEGVTFEVGLEKVNVEFLKGLRETGRKDGKGLRAEAVTSAMESKVC
jgi:hypothetical protein